MSLDCRVCPLMLLQYNGGQYPPACLLGGFLRNDEKDVPLPPPQSCPMRTGRIDVWLVRLFRFRTGFSDNDAA